MKGIILAGGKATRLYPITKEICKQLLPVYNKPMIYYPLSVLMLTGIRDILIISTPDNLKHFQNIFGKGKDLGLHIQYAVQPRPQGIAQAFLIGKKFIQKEPVCLILGDNIFYGDKLPPLLKQASQLKKGAAIFAYKVRDPQRYGVISFDKRHRVTSIVEKPKKPKSEWVVTGLYFYDHQVVPIAKSLKPSHRGELEITDVNQYYLRKGQLSVQLLGRGNVWLDTGTYDSLIDASVFIKTIEERAGLRIGCVEEIAHQEGFISTKQLLKLAQEVPTSYGEYLRKLCRKHE